MNPWLQRFLIGWAAGVVTTGALVSTAKRPHRLKRKKRKKQEDGTEEPVQIGAVAMKDARLPDERGLTVGEWRDRVVASGASLGTRVGAVFKRERRPTTGGAAAGGTTPSALEPDEVQRTDGTVEKSASTRKKRRGAHAKGRRGKKRKEATLWDSAKESFKQTVKETVAEEVNKSPMGSALETLKDVGAKVKSGATSAATATASFVKRGIDGNPEPDDGSKPTPSLQQRIDAAGAAIEKAVKNATDGPEPRGSAEPTVSARAAESADEPRPNKNVDAAAEVAAEVAVKVKSGLLAVGSWLQGPGAPGYKKAPRASDGGEVVEAKDARPSDAKPHDDEPGDAANSDDEAAQ